MRAMIIKEFGGSSVFEMVDIPMPDIEPHEVLIEVKASSVNPVDWKIRAGFAPPLCPQFPAVLHADSAGVVIKTGANVKHLTVGDNVYSFGSGLVGKQGALAEYMPADARLVAKMPRNLNFTEAATLPLVGVTSWMALVDRAEAQTGQSVLIQGGTGGVGFLALQLARARIGDEVYATCGSDEKCAIAESLGAKRAFNYKDISAAEIMAQSPSGQGFDIVFNTPGEPAINNSVQVTKFRGTILDINGAFPTEGPFQVNCLNFMSIFGGYPVTHDFEQDHIGHILSQLATLVEAGQIKPLIDEKHFSFTDVGAAHDYLQNESPLGKVSLTADWL